MAGSHAAHGSPGSGGLAQLTRWRVAGPRLQAVWSHSKCKSLSTARCAVMNSHSHCAPSDPSPGVTSPAINVVLLPLRLQREPCSRGQVQVAAMSQSPGGPVLVLGPSSQPPAPLCALGDPCCLSAPPVLQLPWESVALMDPQNHLCPLSPPSLGRRSRQRMAFRGAKGLSQGMSAASWGRPLGALMQ